MPKGQRKQAEAEKPQALSNSAARKDLIRSTHQKLMDVNSKIRALQLERTELKNRHIKGDLGMKIADFNVALRMYDLEGDDRDELFDTINETFKALAPGQQSSFLDAVEKRASGSRNRRHPTPEDLGETVNRPHEDMTSDEEWDKSAPDEAENPDDPGDENDDGPREATV